MRLPTSSSLENLLWLPPQGGRCPGQGSRESGEGGATRRPEGGGPASRTCRCRKTRLQPPAGSPTCSGFSLAAVLKPPPSTGRGVPSRTHSPGRKNSLPAPPSSGTETGIGILRRGRATAPRPPGQITPAGLTRAGTLPSPRPAQILPGNEYSVRRYLPRPSLEHLFYFRLDRRRQCMVGNVKR